MTILNTVEQLINYPFLFLSSSTVCSGILFCLGRRNLTKKVSGQFIDHWDHPGLAGKGYDYCFFIDKTRLFNGLALSHMPPPSYLHDRGFISFNVHSFGSVPLGLCVLVRLLCFCFKPDSFIDLLHWSIEKLTKVFSF